MTKEPKSATMLSARLARAYPSLSAYSAATLAEELCRIERAQHRHAERCCSGADGGYTQTIWRTDDEGRNVATQIHDPDAEARAGVRIYERFRKWKQRLAGLGGIAKREGLEAQPLETLTGSSVELTLDPRGAVLKVRLPGEAEAVAL